MESALYGYLRSHCFVSFVLCSLLRFLICQQLVRTYRKRALSKDDLGGFPTRKIPETITFLCKFLICTILILNFCYD